MRPSDSRLPNRISAIPAMLLLCVSPMFFALAQSRAFTTASERFQFPSASDLQPTHAGKPLTALGLSDAEIETLTMLIWDSGTIEPALPSDYELRDEFLARRIDFGTGKQNGLVLQATNKFCDDLGNCRTWFLQKIEGKWQSLADQRIPNEGVRAFEFAISKPAADEPPNLILIIHTMDNNYPTRVWELEKGKYIPEKFFCWHRAANTFEQKPCVDFQLPARMHGSHQSVGISERDLDNETVAELIAMTIGKGDADKEMLGDTDPEEELLATHLDMGEGRENGLVVQGSENLCGATGNCAMWFLRKIDGKWKLLKFEDEDFGTLVSMFEAVPPKHSGLYELILGSHFNAFEVPFVQLWFDGKKYVVHQTYCRYNETGEVLAGDCE